METTIELTEGLIAAELSDFFGPDDKIKIIKESADFVSVYVKIHKPVFLTLIPLRWSVTSVDFLRHTIRMHRRK